MTSNLTMWMSDDLRNVDRVPNVPEVLVEALETKWVEGYLKQKDIRRRKENRKSKQKLNGPVEKPE